MGVSKIADIKPGFQYVSRCDPALVTGFETHRVDTKKRLEMRGEPITVCLAIEVALAISAFDRTSPRPRLRLQSGGHRTALIGNDEMRARDSSAEGGGNNLSNLK
jgi:hypothetical protein